MEGVESTGKRAFTEHLRPCCLSPPSSWRCGWPAAHAGVSPSPGAAHTCLLQALQDWRRTSGKRNPQHIHVCIYAQTQRRSHTGTDSRERAGGVAAPSAIRKPGTREPRGWNPVQVRRPGNARSRGCRPRPKKRGGRGWRGESRQRLRAGEPAARRPGAAGRARLPRGSQRALARRAPSPGPPWAEGRPPCWRPSSWLSLSGQRLTSPRNIPTVTPRAIYQLSGPLGSVQLTQKIKHHRGVAEAPGGHHVQTRRAQARERSGPWLTAPSTPPSRERHSGKCSPQLRGSTEYLALFAALPLP